MMPWRRRYLTTEQISEYFHVDPKSAKRWFKEHFGHDPTCHSGWDVRAVSRLRRTLKRNRSRLSTPAIAKKFGVNRATIEKGWAQSGLILPPVTNLIGCYRGRSWTPADVARLSVWLRKRYGAINGSLGHPVKPTGRGPSRRFFLGLAEKPPQRTGQTA